MLIAGTGVPIACKCGCGRRFSPRSWQQKFATRACCIRYKSRVYYYRHRKLYEKQCGFCGQRFVTPHSDKQYCTLTHARSHWAWTRGRVRRRAGLTVRGTERKRPSRVTDRNRKMHPSARARTATKKGESRWKSLRT